MVTGHWSNYHHHHHGAPRQDKGDTLPLTINISDQVLPLGLLALIICLSYNTWCSESPNEPSLLLLLSRETDATSISHGGKGRDGGGCWLFATTAGIIFFHVKHFSFLKKQKKKKGWKTTEYQQHNIMTPHPQQSRLDLNWSCRLCSASRARAIFQKSLQGCRVAADPAGRKRHNLGHHSSSPVWVRLEESFLNTIAALFIGPPLARRWRQECQYEWKNVSGKCRGD